MSSPSHLSTTKDGYRYDVARDQVTTGCQTEAVKSSSAHTEASYDVIIIGCGFTGLAAARDLSIAGKRVLLLEARDRIGGRTYTTHVDGHNYEMGGTWIHWLQPHVWAEVTRYGLVDNVKMSTCMSKEADVSYLNDAKDGTIRERPEKTDERLLPLIHKLMDIDGDGGETVFPQPWLPLENREVWGAWDISLQERVDQLDISQADRDFVLSWLSMNTCSAPAQSSFLNLLRLYSLSGYEFNIFMEICGKYKLKDGTSRLASAIYSEFTGDSQFNCIVKSISSTREGMVVTSKDGRSFSGKEVICTIPLHCLPDVEFSPPLPSAFVTAKHANFGGKVHLHSSSPVDPWFGVSDGHHSVCAAFTESPSAQGGTHLVSFAVSDKLIAKHHIKDNPKAYIEAVTNDVTPNSVHMETTHLVWHDWARDEFSKGAWGSYGPKQLSNGLGEIMRNTKVSEGLQLVNSDWASGWVGYIDGALEMGRKAARDVKLHLDGIDRR
ncbi:uncharacterized protein E0L32_003884 [Thyridium curvatum]|uniref:Amine oxidase n=1 Tax=Thyridium curvatum TaxID=1093900 RepID=A0A507AZH0_9PEZI|nr:uncharacterized protein E0L32_003884 [Thyridium curvatum]TPX16235.1 hypothetical protein E0L32_003884 [Thyridium curvatum]